MTAPPEQARPGRRPPRGDGASRDVAALRAEVASLEERLAARDAFLAVAAHELRNPMTPILAQVQRLRRRAGELPPAAVDEALARIEALVEGYVRRATTLLDVARLTQDGFRLDPAPVDVAAIAAGAVAAMEPAASYAGSALTFEGPARCLAHLDRTALEQVLDNLISNAVKYGAGRPVAVMLSEAGGEVRIAVRDEGGGISPADQARIFDRFERAVAKGSSVGGFGVGLWVSSGLARAMGGSLAVASEPGRGSTFTLALPAAPEGPVAPGTPLGEEVGR